MLHNPKLTVKNLVTLKYIGTNRIDLTKDKNVLTKDSIA
jgi:hypothetical protein